MAMPFGQLCADQQLGTPDPPLSWGEPISRRPLRLRLCIQTVPYKLCCGRQTKRLHGNDELTCKATNDDSHVDLGDHAERCAPCSGSQLFGDRMIGCSGSRVHLDRIRKSPRYLHRCCKSLLCDFDRKNAVNDEISTCPFRYVTPRTMIRTTRSMSRASGPAGSYPWGLYHPRRRSAPTHSLARSGSSRISTGDLNLRNLLLAEHSYIDIVPQKAIIDLYFILNLAGTLSTYASISLP